MKKNCITYKKYMARQRRKKSIRKKVFGTEERPRLVVYRSNKNISGQLVNDETGHILMSASTLSKVIEIDRAKKKIDQSFDVGFQMGKLALEKGFTHVCFDRNGFLYHGRVRAFAEGARKAGLKF